jgi:aldehyde dehydrogenase (NAD+)
MIEGMDNRIYVDGGWQQAAGSDLIEVVNPATEAVIGTVAAGSAADIDTAVAAARAAAPRWASSSPENRARILSGTADVLKARADEASALITAELGAPLSLS